MNTERLNPYPLSIPGQKLLDKRGGPHDEIAPIYMLDLLHMQRLQVCGYIYMAALAL